MHSWSLGSMAVIGLGASAGASYFGHGALVPWALGLGSVSLAYVPFAFPLAVPSYYLSRVLVLSLLLFS